MTEWHSYANLYNNIIMFIYYDVININNILTNLHLPFFISLYLLQKKKPALLAKSESNDIHISEEDLISLRFFPKQNNKIHVHILKINRIQLIPTNGTQLRMPYT